MKGEASATVTRLEFDHNGFRGLLTSSGIYQALAKIADEVDRDATAAAGLDEAAFFAEVVEAKAATRYRYPGRYLGIVSTTSQAGREAQATGKVLSSAAVQPREV